MLLVSCLKCLMVLSYWYLILFSISYLQKVEWSRLLCLRNLIIFCFWDKLTLIWDLFIYIIHSFFSVFLRLRFIAFRRIMPLIILIFIIYGKIIILILLFIFVSYLLIYGSCFLFWGLLFSFLTSYWSLSMSFILLSLKYWIGSESIIKYLDKRDLPLDWAWHFSLLIINIWFWILLWVSFWRRRLH